MADCFGCRFALGLKPNGKQMRCAKAEQLFGGTRWVDVLPESKCGKFEPFVGDDSRAPSQPPNKIKKKCAKCLGMKTKRYRSLKGGYEWIKCPYCDGKGEID